MPPKRARLDLSYLRSLAQQENAPAPVTAEAIKKTLIPSAAKDFDVTIKHWKMFSDKVLDVCIDKEPVFINAPSVHLIKTFMQWFAATRHGVLEDIITDTTLLNRLSSLKRVIRLYTNYQYSEAQNKEIHHCLRKEMVQTGQLSTMAHKKPIAPYAVAKDLVHFSWACDEYQHPHPRAYLQLAFSLLLMSHTGPRPGEMVESDAWQNTNEGILYKDIDLVRYQSDKYVGFAIHVRLRNRKGQRTNAKHCPQLPLFEEPFDRPMCPVALFIALALADGVFEGCSTFNDIQAQQVPLGATQHIYKISSSATKIPILRTINAHGVVSKDRIMTYSCFNNMLKGVGQRAAYEDNLSAYCFRRGFARAVTQHASSAAAKALMGHAHESTIQYYTSGFVGIDSQSLVRGKEQRHDLIEENLSMMSKRNLYAPKPPGSQLTDQPKALFRDPSGLREDGSVIALPDLAPSKEYEARRQSRKKEYCKQRERFFTGAEDTPRRTSADTPSRSPSRYLLALWKFEPERQKLVDLMYPDGTNHESIISLEDVVVPMAKLADPQKRRYAYKSAEPTDDNSCRDCKEQLKSARPARMNAHLLQCARQRRIKEAREHMTKHFRMLQTCQWNDCNYRFRSRTCGAYSMHVTKHITEMRANQCLWGSCGDTFNYAKELAYHVSLKHRVPNEWTILTKMHYCYEHDEWCQSDQQWAQHIKLAHFSQLNDFCGLIRRNGLVVVAAHCLFCLGDSTVPMVERFQQFSDVYVLHDHMKKHLAQLDAPPLVCPHPRCKDDLGSEEVFWDHANTVHGIAPFVTRRTTGKRKLSDDMEMEGDEVADGVHELALVRNEESAP